MAVARVSTARVAASMASAEREPWAAAVRRASRADAGATRAAAVSRPTVKQAAPRDRGFDLKGTAGRSSPGPCPSPAASRRSRASARSPSLRLGPGPATATGPPALTLPAPRRQDGHRRQGRRRAAEAAAVAVPLTTSDTVAHVLVTNDFPPKVGGIQSYLWELWRRLPPERVTVLTTTHPDAAAFDAAQPFAVHRHAKVLLPTPALVAEIRRVAAEAGAALVVLDPALPVGLLGPRLGLPYGVVLHGAEVTVPARLPGARQLLTSVLRGATCVVAAGGYPAAEAFHLAGDGLPVTVVPPGSTSTGSGR